MEWYQLNVNQVEESLQVKSTTGLMESEVEVSRKK